MVKLKTPEEIEKIAEGGKLLHHVLSELEALVIPGTTGKQIDEHARKLMAELGARPAFLGYRGFPAAACVSVNDAVVHGLPTDKQFQEGDIVGIDVGLIYHGLYTDSARTVGVGRITPDSRKLLDVTQEALRRGIEAAQVQATTGDIGNVVQAYVEGEGYGVVRQLVGHGVGHAVHEEPSVPNFGRAGSGHKLEEGLVIAIEPMVTVGDPGVETASDNWTVVTKAGGPAAHFEHTVAITAEGPRILTE